MSRAPFGAEVVAECATCPDAEAIVGRLAIDEKPRSRCQRLRALGAVAAPLFADDEQQPDVRDAFPPQLLDGGYLAGGDPLRVARAAAIQRVAVEMAGKKRRDAIEMRRQDD